MRFLHRTRNTYWSCTDVADKIRGTPKMSAATSEEWHKWKIEIKKKSPLRYWIAEELLDYLQDIVYFPYDVINSIRIYINNRFVYRLHLMNTKLKPGSYYEFDTRLIHGAFETFIDFIDSECASYMLAISNDEFIEKVVKKYLIETYQYFPPGKADAIINEFKELKRKKPWFSFKPFRNETLGLAHIVSEIEEFREEHPSQSERAREMLELYTWWKKDYLTRKDSYEIYFPISEEKDDVEDEEEINYELTDEKRAIYKKIDELEKSREAEDTEMLIRLIKLRRSIWT
jgi:hypothetical protein